MNLEEKIEDMINNGVCEYLRMESQGPAIHDKLWEAHLELSRELDELHEYVLTKSTNSNSVKLPSLEDVTKEIGWGAEDYLIVRRVYNVIKKLMKDNI